MLTPNVPKTGDSAGGTLSTLCGHYFNPPPKAVIDVFGLVDFTDPWYYKVSEDGANVQPYHRLLSGKFTEEQLEHGKKDKDPTNACYISPWTWELEPELSVEKLQKFWGMPDYLPGDKEIFRMDLMKYLALNKSMTSLLLGMERTSENEKEFLELAKSWSSLYLLEGKKSYPPTFFLHGDNDVAVPIEQSYRMAKKLREMGVEVGEGYQPGGEHCFEQLIEVSQASDCRCLPVMCLGDIEILLIFLDLQSPEDEGWNEYVVSCLDFIDKHVKA